jgi:hypothetical protein
MYPASIRRSLSLLFILSLLTGVSAHAGKRRAVAHPSPSGDLISVAILSGVVLDDATGLPVNAARVSVGTKSDVTGSDGKFSVKNATGYGSIAVEATRSGYLPKSMNITTSGNQQITLRMTPTPPVLVKRTDGTTVSLDYESVEFGYPIVFSGYRKYQYEDFCKNGVAVQIDRSEIKKINGPATIVSGSPCCPSKDVLKVNLELKTGEKVDVYFIDSCEAGETKIDLIGREHIQGQFVYIGFSELSEVVFP